MADLSVSFPICHCLFYQSIWDGWVGTQRKQIFCEWNIQFFSYCSYFFFAYVSWWWRIIGCWLLLLVYHNFIGILILKQSLESRSLRKSFLLFFLTHTSQDLSFWSASINFGLQVCLDIGLQLTNVYIWVLSALNHCLFGHD